MKKPPGMNKLEEPYMRPYYPSAAALSPGNLRFIDDSASSTTTMTSISDFDDSKNRRLDKHYITTVQPAMYYTINPYFDPSSFNDASSSSGSDECSTSSTDLEEYLKESVEDHTIYEFSSETDEFYQFNVVFPRLGISPSRQSTAENKTPPISNTLFCTHSSMRTELNGNYPLYNETKDEQDGTREKCENDNESGENSPAAEASITNSNAITNENRDNAHMTAGTDIRLSDKTVISKPKVRFKLDPEYENECQWQRLNRMLGNHMAWTDECEV